MSLSLTGATGFSIASMPGPARMEPGVHVFSGVLLIGAGAFLVRSVVRDRLRGRRRGR